MPAAISDDRLAQALDATGNLIAGVANNQWSNPTPCPQWDVRALVNHLVFGNKMFAAILRGEQPLSQRDLARLRNIDQLGDNPLEAYRDAGAELQAAFTAPEVLERVYQVPVGRVPGAVMLHLRITEILVHGWDLARATGQPVRLSDELAEEELTFARSDAAPDVGRTGHPFGPALRIAEDARAIDRLAAFLGRAITTNRAEADRE